MRGPQITVALGSLLLLAVMLLFFVQPASGGFQATQGPHSTLTEQMNYLKLMALMVFVACFMFNVLILSASQPQATTPMRKVRPLFLATETSAMRC